ncbi:MAG: transposase, partial [Cyanobacteria bacterium]|nr:transposase [Cyanobacteriota bacterium]
TRVIALITKRADPNCMRQQIPISEQERSMSNKRRKYSLEQVEQWLQEAKTSKTPIVEVAAKHGVSPGVLYKWRKWISYRNSKEQEFQPYQDAMQARLNALESTVTQLKTTITELESKIEPSDGVDVSVPFFSPDHTGSFR